MPSDIPQSPTSAQISMDNLFKFRTGRGYYRLEFTDISWGYGSLIRMPNDLRTFKVKQPMEIKDFARTIVKGFISITVLALILTFVAGGLPGVLPLPVPLLITS